MRVPSIHITINNLELIFKQVLGEYSNLDYKLLAKQVGKESRKFTCNNRSVINSTNKLVRDTDRMVASGNMDVFKFQVMLNKVRATFKHIGITTIKPGSRDWLALKEVAGNALEFAKVFNIKPENAYVIYCKIGISKMQRYNISKFVSLHSIICEQYRAEDLIEKDIYSNHTSNMHNQYCKAIIDRVGISTNYLDDPINYGHFVEATQQALSVGGKVDDYLTAQLEAFAWRSDYPLPIQLKGEKALNRFISYAFKNNIQLRKKQ